MTKKTKKYSRGASFIKCCAETILKSFLWLSHKYAYVWFINWTYVQKNRSWISDRRTPTRMTMNMKLSSHGFLFHSNVNMREHRGQITLNHHHNDKKNKKYSRGASFIKCCAETILKSFLWLSHKYAYVWFINWTYVQKNASMSLFQMWNLWIANYLELACKLMVSVLCLKTNSN